LQSEVAYQEDNEIIIESSLTEPEVVGVINYRKNNLCLTEIVSGQRVLRLRSQIHKASRKKLLPESGRDGSKSGKYRQAYELLK
jgi:hypothetical protein